MLERSNGDEPRGFTYEAVGATRDLTGRPWPVPGFRTLRRQTRLGSGDAVFAAAAAALLEWRMHRGMGVVVDTAAPRAVTGAQVTVRIGAGRLRVPGPCRVVWVAAGPDGAGWAYGTLPGHPVSGEEAFWVSRDEDGTVRLTVAAFSRPVTRWARAAGPLLRLFQHAYAWHCGRVLRRIATREARTG